MKYAHKHLMVAGLLAAVGMVAGAQTPPASPQATPGHTMAREGHGHADPARMLQRMARMQERMARHLSEFKQKLQLSPAQESAWSSYVAALKPSGNFKRADRAELATLSTPERIDRMRARHAERLAQMDKRGEATKTFYAVLSPEQKKVFDDATVHREHRGHRHHRHHRHHHAA